MRKVILTLSFLLVSFSVANAQTGRAIEDRLLAHLANIEKWSNYGLNADERKLALANKSLSNDLFRFGRLPAMLSYSFPRLKTKMHVTTSADAKFRTYSWDEGTGGTMHEFTTVAQFKGANGEIYVSSVGLSGFVHNIFQLNTPDGTIYLAVSTFIVSGSRSEENIQAIKIAGTRVNADLGMMRTTEGLMNSVDFSYEPPADGPLFTFNESGKSFSFPVVIEDEDTAELRVTKDRITYRFDGKYFVKVD